jgi:Mg/Co/Ni transporter MgtE
LEEMQKKVGLGNSVILKQFSDSKYGEIIELLRDYPDHTIFERLKKIDPQHAAKYDEVLR